VFLIAAVFVLPIAQIFYVVFEKMSFKFIQSHKKALHKPVIMPEPLEPSKEISV
jgi:hypothetical protein